LSQRYGCSKLEHNSGESVHRTPRGCGGCLMFQLYRVGIELWYGIEVLTFSLLGRPIPGYDSSKVVPGSAIFSLIVAFLSSNTMVVTLFSNAPSSVRTYGPFPVCLFLALHRLPTYPCPYFLFTAFPNGLQSYYIRIYPLFSRCSVNCTGGLFICSFSDIPYLALRTWDVQ